MRGWGWGPADETRFASRAQSKARSRTARTDITAAWPGRGPSGRTRRTLSVDRGVDRRDEGAGVGPLQSDLLCSVKKAFT